jgi:hypothetical protein
MEEAERAARPRMELALKRVGKRAKRKKKPSSAARPRRLSAMRERQVRLATVRSGTPLRFQSERRGHCDT